MLLGSLVVGVVFAAIILVRWEADKNLRELHVIVAKNFNTLTRMHEQHIDMYADLEHMVGKLKARSDNERQAAEEWVSSTQVVSSAQVLRELADGLETTQPDD